MSDYEHGLGRLAKSLKLMTDADWTPTEERKSLERIADRLEALALDLEGDGAAPAAIELQHDVRCGYLSFRQVPQGMRELAASARAAAAELPNPRRKFALEFAAMALLHLRALNGFPDPTFYDDGVAVVELETVCILGGVYLERVTLRNALSKAWKQFDKNYFPPGVRDIVMG